MKTALKAPKDSRFAKTAHKRMVKLNYRLERNKNHLFYRHITVAEATATCPKTPRSEGNALRHLEAVIRKNGHIINEMMKKI